MRIIRHSFLTWLQVPSRLELSFLYILLGIYMVVATDSVIPSCWIVFVIYSFVCVVLIMCFRLVTLLVLALVTGVPKKVWASWVQLGFIALIIILLFWTNLGLSVRLRISGRALVEQVDKVFSMHIDSQKQLFERGPEPIGFFAIRTYRVEPHNRTVWFHTEDGEALFGVPSLMGGIVYCEQGQPSEIGETVYQHLWGPWWRWAQDI